MYIHIYSYIYAQVYACICTYMYTYTKQIVYRAGAHKKPRGTTRIQKNTYTKKDVYKTRRIQNKTYLVLERTKRHAALSTEFQCAFCTLQPCIHLVLYTYTYIGWLRAVGSIKS